MAARLTRGIIFIPLDVRWPRTKKVRAMIVRHGEEGFAAWGLYLALVCYCRENLTDGFVPADEIGALAYPLPADAAERLLKVLGDYRLVSPGHSPGHSDGHSPGYGDGYVVPAYVKRNGTRADTLDRAEKLREQGRRGALTRWPERGDSPGHSPGHSRGQAETDRETKTDDARPPARGAARVDGSWSPSAVLDRKPARRPPAPRDSAAVLAEQYRPGGPATDEQRAARADQARKGLANRPARLDQPEPTGAGLTGEALARAQLAEIEQRRAAERAIDRAAITGEPAATVADPIEPPWPDDDDDGDPLGLGGGTERELPTGEAYVDHGDPENDPGRADADEPGRGEQTDAEPTEPGEDEYPF
jgi:hypothetical protein